MSSFLNCQYFAEDWCHVPSRRTPGYIKIKHFIF